MMKRKKHMNECLFLTDESGIDTETKTYLANIAESMMIYGIIFANVQTPTRQGCISATSEVHTIDGAIGVTFHADLGVIDRPFFSCKFVMRKKKTPIETSYSNN